jgi:hypothetical protein
MFNKRMHVSDFHDFSHTNFDLLAVNSDNLFLILPFI